MILSHLDRCGDEELNKLDMEVNTKIPNQKMPAGNEADPVHGGVPDAEEIEALLRQVMGKRLMETALIEINDALMKLLEKQKAEEPEQQSDSAKFSNESLASSRSEEYEASRQRQLEQLLEEILKFLENWQPQPGWALSQEIKQLGDIYQKLLQDVLKLYANQEQAGIQSDRINGLLLAIVDRLGDNKFPSLLFLLENYGDKGAADFLRASVFSKITGRNVSSQEVASARKQWVHGEEKKSSTFQAAQGKIPASPAQEKGILYSRTKGNRIDTNRQYKEWVQAVERFRLQSGTEEKRVNRGNRFFYSQYQSYSASDIEQTERFLDYITEKGNLYENPALTARSEELLGFLMAASMVKVQIYSEYAGVGSKMAGDVWNALERFFRHYLAKAIDPENQHSAGAGNVRWLDSKIIQRIYYQVMELVQRAKSPGKGLEKGLQYVCQVYLSKKEKNEGVQKRKSTGFFSASTNGKDKLEDLKYGAGALDQDWKEFLDSIGQNSNALLQSMYANCPWGILMEGEGENGTEGKHASTVLSLLAVTGLFILIVIAGLFFRGMI